jgi:hypothetical protein
MLKSRNTLGTFAIVIALCGACGDDSGSSTGPIGSGGAGASGTAATAGTSAGAAGRASAAGSGVGGAGRGASGSAGHAGSSGTGVAGSNTDEDAGVSAGTGAAGAGGKAGASGSAAGASGSTAGAGGMGAAGSGGTAAATFTQVYAIFMTGCMGSTCHVGATRPGDMLSMADKATAYMNLVNVNSVSCTGEKRVVPSDPAKSELVAALAHTKAGNCARTPQMPDNKPMLPASDIDKVRSWVQAGAKND